ncbi:nucleotide exchange factor GrpE [Bifidobacterium reuteri]|uniref:Nucleotide exchange factor GrpE n=1 Tax=Bifidobacterium reuteri TaxID=983706 RepID=A0A5J5DZB5_9BIFI|nr:nucleotide exchange factor GrpE [Bifidobacterium reuteri]KAA8822247.1 nucleotide exchange factor GrpE [Bifidobacterium reuteri]
MSDDQIKELTQEVAGLRDLFLRRLADDKTTKQLVQSVNASLTRRDAIDQYKVFAPMVKELLLAVDRLKSNDPSADLNQSVADELVTVLSRYGVEQIDTDGIVDPKVHEIVGLDPLTDGVQPDTIVKVVRTGYLLSGSVLRPAQVIVARNK